MSPKTRPNEAEAILSSEMIRVRREAGEEGARGLATEPAPGERRRRAKIASSPNRASGKGWRGSAPTGRGGRPPAAARHPRVAGRPARRRLASPPSSVRRRIDRTPKQGRPHLRRADGRAAAVARPIRGRAPCRGTVLKNGEAAAIGWIAEQRSWTNPGGSPRPSGGRRRSRRPPREREQSVRPRELDRCCEAVRLSRRRRRRIPFTAVIRACLSGL